MTLTPRALAQHGGWLVHAVAGADLRQSYRNHLVDGATASAADTYFLPRPARFYASSQIGRGVALGTVLFVHNDPDATEAVTVKDADGATINVVLEGESQAFCLIDDTSDAGEWVRISPAMANGRGTAVPLGFRFDLQITSSRNNLHLLTEAVANGYDGSVPAIITCTIADSAVLGSAATGSGSFSTGGAAAVGGVNWHASSLLVLRNYGLISGRGGQGGQGGIGGTGASSGLAGEDGGMAFRVEFPLLLWNFAVIRGGGGGGGGGNGSAGTPGLHGGGGGGGLGAFRQANGLTVGGAAGGQATTTGVRMSTAGTLWQPGNGGLGATAAGNTGGQGGEGGDAAAAGTAGWTLNNAAQTAGAAGAAGPAIVRNTAATLTIAHTGTITGATVVV